MLLLRSSRNYTITVEKQGFKTLQKTKNALQVGGTINSRRGAGIGSVSETVTVTGGTEQLQTAKRHDGKRGRAESNRSVAAQRAQSANPVVAGARRGAEVGGRRRIGSAR